MAGLRQHLRASDFEHGRLAYRRDCPRCRPRRLGQPENPAPVVPVGVAALIAASVIPTASAGVAIAKTHSPPPPPPPSAPAGIDSSLTPPPSQCAPDDPTCNGSTPVDTCSDPSCGDPAAAPSEPVDSSPASTTPTDAPAPPPDPASTTSAPPAPPPPPAAAAPTDTTATPPPAAASPTDTTPTPPPAAPPTDTTPAATTPAASAPAVTPTATPAPATTTTTAPPPPVTPVTPTVTVPRSLGSIAIPGRLRAVERSRLRQRTAVHQQQTVTLASGSTPRASGGAATPSPSASQADTATTAGSATGAAPPSADSHGKNYVVRAGDSLWLIAKRLLAPEASNADIARLVNRIWTLNASRIDTGSPNLLPVGVVLTLP